MTPFEDITKLSKAMSEESRVNIVGLIQREGNLCVCEICDTLGISQPLVSKYLKQLKDAQILVSKKQGKWVIYNIVKNPNPLLTTYLVQIKENEYSINKLMSCTIR